MPPDAWGRPWQEWCDADTHTRKNSIYVDLLRLNPPRPLPLLSEVFIPYGGAIITSASYWAATAVLQSTRFGSRPNLLGTSISLSDRILVLARATKYRPTVYFDDDVETVKKASVEVPTLKYVIHVNEGVYTQYVNGKENGTWTPSYWPVVETNG
jgi:hypothetical protein